MDEDHRPKPPPETSGSREIAADENSSQPHGGFFCQTLLKIKKNAKKKAKRFKCSRNNTPAVQNADHEGASSNQNIEHTSDGDKLPASANENQSGRVNQGTPGEPAFKVLDAPSGVEEIPDAQLVDAELRGAREGTENMRLLGGHVTSVASAANNAPAGLAVADNFQTTYLQPLKIFDTVIGNLANVHPYAKIVLGVLSAASEVILAQTARDQSVQSLLKKLEEVYSFMSQDDTLGQISSKRSIFGRIAQQTLECACFIRDYSEKQSFWKRLGKNAVSETDDLITQYNNALDGLMQQFRDQAIRDVADLVRCTTDKLGDKLHLSDIPYAAGAGLDTTKQCLPGTRMDILSQITEWINDSGDTAQRVLWLSGPAGKGKSAIAHTIANWFNDLGGLGSCFCFDRHHEADKRHEKVFSTIARDLADRDAEMRRALADTVENANALKKTTDIIQQWQKLFMEPLGKLSRSSVGPVLIVIEALDESGGRETRRDLLRILSGKLQDKGLPQIAKLPPNFRILVTSRPLRDIDDAFHGAQHILRLSMDDIPQTVAKSDIHTFVSEELKELPDFRDKEFAVLADKAGGLFEWARLACKYIQETPPGLYPIDRFNAVVSHDHGERKNLLHDIYGFILGENMGKDRYTKTEYQRALAKFHSVMGQILGSAEPLPLDALNAMRSRLPDQREHYKVKVVVEHMGSLLSGTTNPSSPIRPLHASFRDFLTDKSSSGDFFVDMANVQRDLAFASLRVMEHDLRFNMCNLKSSYLPNSKDTGLPNRVATCISSHLSYSCRSWATHVQATDFDTELAKEIRSFFDNERLLFWIESLGLLNALSGAVAVLPLITQWLKGQLGYEDILSTAMDVQRFVQVFGGMILHSTPHLYISALPFSPTKSTIATRFTARFPNTLRLMRGRLVNWTAIQTMISGHTSDVTSVSFSPNGTRIVSGSLDSTVRLWDAATGLPVGEPFRGHTNSVQSVSFSPDSTRVVSGSSDSTIQLWDTATGLPLGEPFRGHTRPVCSVSFSPDGTRIVSGSKDSTVRLWDAVTGLSLGEPFRGHTDSVSSVSFSPDGTRIVSSSEDSTVRLWDTATGLPLGEPFRGHTDSVWSVSFSPDGTRIVSGSRDSTIRLWDTVTGLPLGEPFRGHTDSVSSVSFSLDGTRIVSGSRDSTIRLWDAVTGLPLGEPFRGHTRSVWSVSFSPDGTRIVSGSRNSTVQLWDAATGLPLGEPFRGHTGPVLSGSFSPDGTRIVSGSSDSTVQLWDAATGLPLGEPFRGHTDSVWSVSFSPDGTRIVSGSLDSTIRIWDAATGLPVGEPLQGHTDMVWSVSFSSDGTRIVSGSKDSTVRLWDAVTGLPLGEPFRGHTDSVWSVSFSPDGTRIVSGSSDSTVRLWDTATEQPLGEPFQGHTSSVLSVSFSPDGARIVSGSSDSTVRLWDTATGQPLGEPFRGHTYYPVLSVSFSPNGTRIVSGSSDSTFRLWDAVTGQPLGEPFRGHTRSVQSVSFSPDGTRIVSGSLDSTVRLWDTAMGQLQEHTEINSFAFSLNRRHTIPSKHENTMPTSSWNNRAICFASSLEHALPNSAELLEGSHHNFDSNPVLLKDDGWIVGPDCRLLFWVPPASQRLPLYSPGTAFVIPSGQEIDLSRMAHGEHWSNCRDAPICR